MVSMNVYLQAKMNHDPVLSCYFHHGQRMAIFTQQVVLERNF